jgi:hypothetical protein
MATMRNFAVMSDQFTYAENETSSDGIIDLSD